MARTPEKWVAFLRAHAAELRELGVTRIELDGAAVDLAPPAPPPSLEEPGGRELDPVYPDPLDDPHTYGMGGRVPKFPREEREL